MEMSFFLEREGIKMNKRERRERFLKSIAFLIIAIEVLTIIVVVCLVIRQNRETNSSQAEPTPEAPEIEVVENAEITELLTVSIPDGSYKTYRPKHLSLLPKKELPVANTLEKPYNRTIVSPAEPEPTEVVYGSVEVPENAELVYLGNFYITGYDVCVDCCGKTDGITASGEQASVGRTVAAPSEFSFGTTLYIDGIGTRIVEDRGGMGTQHLDVLCEDHPACYAITGYYDVWEVVKDEMP